MPTITPENIVHWANAYVYAADLGTAAPGDHITEPGASWDFLGEISNDGVRWTNDPSWNAISGYNSTTPYRQILAGEEIGLEVDLLEWSDVTTALAQGGGTWTHVAAAVGPPAIAEHWKYEPADSADRPSNFKAVIFDLVDGDSVFRRICPKALVTSGMPFSSNKEGETAIPVTFSILQPDTGTPYYDLTNIAGVQGVA